MSSSSMSPEPLDPNEELVLAPSPNSLLNEKRYICEECGKGFLRRQNLTLHRRSHNLPFCLRARTPRDPVGRKVYLCPDPNCQHHNRSRALGDFGGLKKHYLRKHCTQKNYKCDTCPKRYAAETDFKAHSKVCGKKRHICHCGARFSRRGKFVSHQEYCTIQRHEAAVQHSPTLQMGDRSSNNFLIRSTNNMEDISMRSTSNNNRSSLIGIYAHSDPHIAAFHNLSRSHPSASPNQSQLRPSGRNNGLMTDPSIGLNMGQIFPDFFSPSTQQTRQNLQADVDMRFYTDLLMDNIPLDGGHIYGNGEGSSSNSSGGVFLSQSSSHNLIPGGHHITSLNGMPNRVFGEGPSSLTQEFDGNYGQGSNYSYGDYSGQSDYGYGNEVSNLETSAGEVAPYGHILNQFRGFWF